MSNINISFNTNGIATAQVILVLREKADLLTIVYQQAFTANSQHNVTVTNLNPVMHQAELWDTSDGTTLNALKGQCDIDAAQSNGSGSFSYIQFKVGSGVVTGTGITTAGTCPVDGDSQYADTALDGLSYLIDKAGFGIMQWDVHIQQITGGGFEYIDGQVFSDLDEYTIIVINSNAGAASTVSSKEITDIIIHTADATLDSTDRNKLHVFNFSGSVAVIEMETLVGVPDKTVYAFSTHIGTQINGEIKFQSGQGCYFRGALKNQIFLGKNETIKIIVKSGACYCMEYDGKYSDVGLPVMSDVSSGPNMILLDGLTAYDGTVYKRLYEWATTVLDAALKVTQAQFDTSISQNDATVFANRGKYVVDTVAKTVRLPDRRGYYPKAAPPDQQAGDQNGWQVGSHFHPSGTETDPTASIFKRAISHLKRFWSAGNGNSSDGSSTDLSSPAGTKNEVNNIVYYPCIII